MPSTQATGLNPTFAVTWPSNTFIEPAAPLINTAARFSQAMRRFAAISMVAIVISPKPVSWSKKALIHSSAALATSPPARTPALSASTGPASNFTITGTAPVWMPATLLVQLGGW